MTPSERIDVVDLRARRVPAADEAVDELDREHARRTRPPDLESASGRVMSVDPDLWLLHVRFERTRTVELRTELVGEYTGYCYRLARRAFHCREPLEDLRQVAMLSLLAALERFECDRSIPFPAFATPTIIGALKRHHRDQGWAVRVPRDTHTVAVGLADAEARVDARLGAGRGRQIDVAEELGIDVADLDRAQAAIRSRATVSLDAPMSDHGHITLEVATFDDGFALAEGRADLQRALTALSPRQRAVLARYFFDGETQSAIADDLGVSQMSISRTLASALACLRSHMDGATTQPSPRPPGLGASEARSEMMHTKG